MITEAALADLGRIAYWMGASGLFLFILAETLWPADPFSTEGERIQHVARNFGLWLAAVIIGNQFYAITLLDLQNRLTETYFGLFHWLDTPLPFELVIGILLLDLSEYIYHRLSHSLRWLWLIHAVHHSDTHLDVTSAMRFHPGEIILNITWKVAICYLLGIPLWFVGARALLMSMASMIQHSNISWPTALDRAFRPVFITPALHRTHHSTDPKENNKNFGEIFSFWDRMFGTYLEVDPSRRIIYGLPNLMERKWLTVMGLLATPFVARNLKSL
jgi:sterol desaturase/sphingolipid hydroxylase (fatty acid hydroxylase superfamily)